MVSFRQFNKLFKSPILPHMASSAKNANILSPVIGCIPVPVVPFSLDGAALFAYPNRRECSFRSTSTGFLRDPIALPIRMMFTEPFSLLDMLRCLLVTLFWPRLPFAHDCSYFIHHSDRLIPKAESQ